MADHRIRTEPVGTVAEETARLVEALGDWARSATAGEAAQPEHSAQPDQASPDQASPDQASPDQAAPDEADHAGRGDDAADAAQPDGGSTAADRAGTRHTPGCERCEGTGPAAGEAITCQLCPVCQGIALLRAVRPETVERLADLAGALSGVLRDIAAERAGQAAPTRPEPPPRRGQRVQDISVDDEDDHRPRAARAHNEQTTSSTQKRAAP
ncbi:MAG TPA: hypothetical protein VFX53_12570 [Pedococcus sp.]|nr:hypothetical protein [Pedococcus sp.]